LSSKNQSIDNNKYRDKLGIYGSSSVYYIQTIGIVPEDQPVSWSLKANITFESVARIQANSQPCEQEQSDQGLWEASK
jgi:hypothetical protein